jgi:hypothetical protein
LQDYGRQFEAIHALPTTMNKTSALIIAVLFASACNNPGSNRNDQKQDVEVTAPPTGNDERANQMDTSVHSGQDSTTTVGYDTSARRKN